MKVLVIDDDQSTTELLKILLSQTASDVQVANSGSEGIELAKESQQDIIILDLMKPDMNGWAVCKALRKFSSVPILIVSALDNPSMVAAALNAGADDYLTKPVSREMLIAQLQMLLRRVRVKPELITANRSH